jgi:hypothetical protein
VNAIECAREHEVVAAVMSGRWPHGCDEELRAHAGACEVCADVVAIADVLKQDQAAMQDVPLPAAGQVWWRSAIRARADAARAAARPVVWLQALTGAGAAGLALAGITAFWPRVEGAMKLLSINPSMLQEALPLLLLAGVGVMAAPIVFYFAVPRD